MKKNPLTLNPETHLLNGVEYIVSPNMDERPEKMPIELVVIHGISLPPGQFGTNAVEQLFTNQLDAKADPYFDKIKDFKVSAHLFIRRNGKIVQFVPFNKRAWHAGVSSFEGRKACNDFSIGIELEGTDKTPYTASQYQALLNVVELLFQHYPSIKPSHIKGHSDIAPNRKTDPGEYFMWQVFEPFFNSTERS